MIIRADLHVHSLASADGSSTVPQLAAEAKARGLDAIAVTDHDACTPLPEIPDVLLIPAAELSTDRGHVLGLFLKTPISEAFLRGYPPLDDCVAEIRRCGGVAVLAHPFAPQKLEERQLQSLSLDGIEAANARAALRPGANEKAAALAKAIGLPTTGGSDAHSASELANAYTEFDAQAATVDALREALLAGRCRAVLQTPCRWRDKGRSRLQKDRRAGGFSSILRARIYQIACIFRDILHI
ncbi:MAG: PHP domain-containing protein [Oscillospiraceae bacterium]